MDEVQYVQNQAKLAKERLTMTSRVKTRNRFKLDGALTEPSTDISAIKRTKSRGKVLDLTNSNFSEHTSRAIQSKAIANFGKQEQDYINKYFFKITHPMLF